MGAGTSTPVRILVVDDDPGDVLMIEEALESSGVEKAIDVVGDGQEAMEFLRGEGRHVGAVRPDMILLDLNMPRMDGRQVLSQVKGDQDLRTIPVVVLTTSSADTDILASYRDAGQCSAFQGGGEGPCWEGRQGPSSALNRAVLLLDVLTYDAQWCPAH